MHYVYAIESLRNGRIYIGQTKDIEKRIAAHNQGRVRSTKAQRPWELIAVQEVEDRGKATWIEKRLKNSHGSRSRWIKRYRIRA